MGCHQSNPEFLALCNYNNIVKTFLKKLKNSSRDRKSLEIRYDKKIKAIKDTFPYSSGESEVKFPDILSDSNPFETLLYFAVHFHWDLIKSAALEYLQDETIQKNLDYFSSQMFRDVITNSSLSKVSKSVSRTIALYFYIRAPSACVIYYKPTFDHPPRHMPIRISETDNTCINVLNELKSSHIILNALTMLCDNVSIDELFEHICKNSYYCFFPLELIGLTAIGDYVFVSCYFMNPHIDHQAATLVTLLHESAELSWSFKKGQESYFKKIPKKDQVTGDQYDSERGNFFEKMIFGKRLVFINSKSAEFLMNPNNWKIRLDKFQRRLERKYNEGVKSGLRSLKIGKRNDFDSCIVLGRCIMSPN